MFLINLFLSFSIANAAMPPLSMILERTAENSPSTLQYVQNLQINPAQNIPNIKETWIVQSPQRLRLTAEFTFDGRTYVLRRDYVQRKSETIIPGQKETRNVPREFTETLHLQKDRGDLQQLLADVGIATSEDLTQRYVKRTGQSFDYYPHSSMVLSRSEGFINYLLFKGSYPQNIERGIWIEQDRFLIRRIKFNDASVSFKKYISVGKTFFFPNERRIEFGGNTVAIKTTSVSSPKKITYTPLEVSSFQDLPDTPITHPVKEFYQRFR